MLMILPRRQYEVGWHKKTSTCTTHIGKCMTMWTVWFVGNGRDMCGKSHRSHGWLAYYELK